MKEKNYEDAVFNFTKYLQNNEANCIALYFRGISYLHLRKPEMAITDFLKVFSLSNKFNKLIYIHLASAYSLKNDFENALKEVKIY